MLNAYLFSGASDFANNVGIWVFVIIGVIWGINLALGFFASFIISGYPNEVSERHIFLVLKALPWIIISPFSYFGVIYGFYGFCIIWTIFQDRLGLFKRFQAYCDKIRDDRKAHIPGWFYWFS
jgi:hypothetical protein